MKSHTSTRSHEASRKIIDEIPKDYCKTFNTISIKISTSVLAFKFDTNESAAISTISHPIIPSPDLQFDSSKISLTQSDTVHDIAINSCCKTLASG